MMHIYPKSIYDNYDTFRNAQVDVGGPAVQVLPPALRESLLHLVEPKVTIATVFMIDVVNTTIIVFFIQDFVIVVVNVMAIKAIKSLKS